MENGENQPLVLKIDSGKTAKSASIIGCLSATTLIGSLLSGMITVATPQIGFDLELGADKILWCVLCK
jgi:hypothetical protein